MMGRSKHKNPKSHSHPATSEPKVNVPEETSIEIKHEGILVAYSATLSRSKYQPAAPAWLMRKEFLPSPPTFHDRRVLRLPGPSKGGETVVRKK